MKNTITIELTEDEMKSIYIALGVANAGFGKDEIYKTAKQMHAGDVASSKIARALKIFEKQKRKHAPPGTKEQG